MEQLDYNLLFRWFLGLGIVANGKVAPLLSDDHFTGDGTLVQAWASMKSFVPKKLPSDTPGPPPAGGSASGPPAEVKPKLEATEPEVAAPSAEPTRSDPGIAAMSTAKDDDKSRNEDVDFHGQTQARRCRLATTSAAYIVPARLGGGS